MADEGYTISLKIKEAMDNGLLIPNLKVIIPLCVARLSGWQIRDFEDGVVVNWPRPPSPGAMQPNMPFELKRRPTNLSYSSWALFEKDQEEFFVRYLAGNRAPRLPQENYMSVGSSFDAYVKAALHSPPCLAPATIRTSSSASCSRIRSRSTTATGRSVLASTSSTATCSRVPTTSCSSCSRLRSSHRGSRRRSTPRSTACLSPASRTFGSCRSSLTLIRCGWCSTGRSRASAPSMVPARARAMPCAVMATVPWGQNVTKKDPGGKPSKSHNTSHANYLDYNHRGLTINAGYMEHCNDEYADQVSLYGWMLGEPPGDEEVVVWIDEIVSKFMGLGQNPLLRVANHRARVSRDHQLKLLGKIKTCAGMRSRLVTFLAICRARIAIAVARFLNRPRWASRPMEATKRTGSTKLFDPSSSDSSMTYPYSFTSAEPAV
jgi:hypothetical protein